MPVLAPGPAEANTMRPLWMNQPYILSLPTWGCILGAIAVVVIVALIRFLTRPSSSSSRGFAFSASSAMDANRDINAGERAEKWSRDVPTLWEEDEEDEEDCIKSETRLYAPPQPWESVMAYTTTQSPTRQSFSPTSSSSPFPPLPSYPDASSHASQQQQQQRTSSKQFSSTSTPPHPTLSQEPSANNNSSSDDHHSATMASSRESSAEAAFAPPRRRSYTKNLPLPAATPGDEAATSTTIVDVNIQGEIIIGEGWRRHTRVYGGGVCLACLESEQKSKEMILAGAVTAQS